MRDGVVLKADVYRPETTDPVPVILTRTQYGKAEAQVKPYRFQTPDWFASHCCLVVVQDIRGQGASGGTFTEFGNDRNDGYDSVEWAARLPGSNGYPQFVPNPSTGQPFGASADTRIATQTILHDDAHPSSVVLPIIPPGGAVSSRFPMGATI